MKTFISLESLNKLCKVTCTKTECDATELWDCAYCSYGLEPDIEVINKPETDDEDYVDSWFNFEGLEVSEDEEA